MQLKNVLKDHFASIMTSIIDNNPYACFNVTLPNYDDHNRANGIPMSSIVKNINQKLTNIFKQRSALPLSDTNMIAHNAHSANEIEIITKSKTMGSVNRNQKNANTNNSIVTRINTSPTTPISPISSNNRDTIINYSNYKPKSPVSRGNDNDTETEVIPVSDNDNDNDNDNYNDNNNGNNILEEVDEKNDYRMESMKNFQKGRESNNKFVHPGIINTSLTDLNLADKVSLEIGYVIIDTFVELYIKYIAQSSEFEINIQSNTRHTLECMFDSHFFAMWSLNSQHKPEVSLKKQASVTANEISLWDKIRYESMVHLNRTKSSINVVKQIESSHKTLIKAEFEKYHEITQDITERELLQWLIKQLIEPTELAVREIARLMNDSFSRFRKNSKVYAKVVHLAREFHNH